MPKTTTNDDIVLAEHTGDASGPKPQKEDYYKSKQGNFNDQHDVLEAGAAEGTEYSWDAEAKKGAKTRHQMDEQLAIQDALGSRKELNQAGQQAQAQHVLQQYSDNQSAQRAGWTGGYVLDQKRQRDYLQASIQANMYGAMELQKLGLESQLSAARLAYDINKEELALERYKTALEYAFAYANSTGILIAPEVRDMNEQYRAAEMMLAEMDLTDDAVLESSEYQRAKNIIKTIERWYQDMGVSPAGAKTMAYQQFQFERDQSIIEGAKATLLTHQILMTDGNGQYKIDSQGNPSVLDLYNDSPEDILNYLKNSTLGQRSFNQFLSLTVEQEMIGIINQNPGVSDQDILELFAQNNRLIGLLDRLGEEVLDFINPERISTDDDGNRILNLPYTHGDGRTFNIRIGLDGQELQDVQQPGTEPGENPSFTPKPIETRYMDAQEDIKSIIDILQTEDNTELNELYNVIANMDVESLFTSSAAVDSWWAELTGISFYADMFGAGKSKASDTVAHLSEVIEEMELMIGEDNIKMLITEAERYEKMSAAEKLRLSDEEKDLLDRVESFATNYVAMELALNIAKMNDTSVLDGFEFVGDSWRSTGQSWQNVSGGITLLRALGQTTFSVVDTVTGGISGVVRWIFGG